MKTCENCSGSSFTQVKTQRNGWKIMRCLRCGLVQVVPKPSKQEVEALYEHDWSHFSPYQSQRDTHRTYFKKLYSFVLQYVPKTHKSKILDIGCATGVFLSLLKKDGIHGVGVDVSRDAVSYCRRQGLSVYNGTCSSVTKAKKWNQTFDMVFACQVVEHERDPLTFFQTAKRVLKPEGIFIITTPNHDTWWRRFMGKHWIGYQHPEHLFFFTPKTIATLLTQSGFDVCLIRQDFPRSYSVAYAFRRLGDYVPNLYWLFRSLEKATKGMQVPIPCNPWGDFLVIGKNVT